MGRGVTVVAGDDALEDEAPKHEAKADGLRRAGGWKEAALRGVGRILGDCRLL